MAQAPLRKLSSDSNAVRATLASLHGLRSRKRRARKPAWQGSADLCLVDARFRELYLTTSNQDLATLYQVALEEINAWAVKLELRKDPGYRREVQRANASKRRLTADQRAALSAKARGRRLSPATVAKIRRTKLERGSVLRGPAHPNWKGGRPWERFRDERYIRWRDAVLERDAYRCRRCGRQCKKRERGLAAHHVRAYATDVGARYDVDNGITLCRACHMELHGHPPPPVLQIACACGCGTPIPERDVYGRVRRYVNHHHSRGRHMSDQAKIKLRNDRRGKPLTLEHRARISRGLRTTSRRVGRPPKA